MTPTFDEAIERLLPVEGGYSNHPSDSGGATRWGVTEALARRYGYRGLMADYPREHAMRVYYEHFWQALLLDEVAETAGDALAHELFEQAVNMGLRRPVGWLQRVLNVMNRGGQYYDDVRVDGLIGRETLGALHAFMRRRGREGAHVLLKALACMQGAFYIELAERRPKDEAFVYGWLLRRI